MSTHKTTANIEDIISFLKEDFSHEITNFEVINGGEGSQAYSFSVGEASYIIRINKHRSLGFQKDEYASIHYTTNIIPIPKIYKIGKINNDLHFCISEKVKGKILTSFSNEERRQHVPELFNVLDAIHATSIDTTVGYGSWNAEGQGENTSWKEFLLEIDKFVKSTPGVPGLFETTFLEKDFWDTTAARFMELVAYCPEDRFLVHGDYGFNNALAEGNTITGIIDWENSVYGDFLYDVAWLSFWSWDIDYQKLYLEHATKKGIVIENFNERMLCYKLFIGLRSAGFFAYSGQRASYDKAKEIMGKML
jgi:hygromycin-B 4-O-kinase